MVQISVATEKSVQVDLFVCMQTSDITSLRWIYGSFCLPTCCYYPIILMQVVIPVKEQNLGLIITLENELTIVYVFEMSSSTAMAAGTPH